MVARLLAKENKKGFFVRFHRGKKGFFFCEVIVLDGEHFSAFCKDCGRVGFGWVRKSKFFGKKKYLLFFVTRDLCKGSVVYLSPLKGG